MPGFVPADPAEFFAPARVRTVLAHHEAGHVLLAYFHGVLLSRFRYLQLGPHLSGSVKYEMNPELDRADPKAAANGHAEMRLAGELAGRIGAGVRVDQIVVFPVKDLPAVGPDTPLLTLPAVPELGHACRIRICCSADMPIVSPCFSTGPFSSR